MKGRKGMATTFKEPKINDTYCSYQGSWSQAVVILSWLFSRKGLYQLIRGLWNTREAGTERSSNGRLAMEPTSDALGVLQLIWVNIKNA
jgi:hypothetical protein